MPTTLQDACGPELRILDRHAPSHPEPRRIQDPRSRQRRHGAQRRAGVLVRRERRGHARVHPRRRRSNRCSSGETFYAHNLGLPELREAVAALHQRPASARWRATASPITSGGVNALMLAVQALVDAGDEVVAVTPVWPNLTAQPLILGAQAAARVAASRRRAPGRWTCTRCWTPITPAHQAADRQRARTTPPAGRSRRAEQQAILGPLPQDRHLDPGRRGLRAAVLRADRQRLRAELPGHRRAGRPAGGGAQLLQELPDDRLAPGLAGDAAGHDAPHGQADRVQHLLRQRVHPARRHRGAAAHRRGHAAGGGAPEDLPRHAGAAAAGAAAASSWRRPRAACTPSSSSTVSTIRWRWPSAWWPRPGSGLAPGQRLRARGAGLAALVLRLQGPGAAGAGRGAAAALAGAART